jgi:hypothetical protein
MAKRHAGHSSSTKNTRIANSDSLKALQQQVIVIAEQLGRIAGVAQATTDGWRNQPALRSKLARIRNRATKLLSRLGTERAAAAERQTHSRELSRAKVAAPGKKHRKAPEPSRSVRVSNELKAKAIATRRRKSPRPRQS